MGGPGALGPWSPLFRRFRERFGDDLPAAAAMAAGLALRLFWLTRKSMWEDEGMTLLVAGHPAVLERLRHMEMLPPLHFLLMRAWLPLFGDPLLALRLFSALMGAAALALFYLWGRRVSRPDAVRALCIASCSSFWIHISQDGRVYALYLVLSLASFLLLERLRDAWSGRAAAAYWVACLAGLYAHYFFALIVGLQFLVLAADEGFRKRRLRAWIALHLALAAAYGPWLPSLADQFRISPSLSPLRETLTPRLAAFHIGAFLFDPGYLGLVLTGWTALVGLGAAALAAIGAWASLRGPAREAGVRQAAYCLGAGLFVVKATELLIGHAFSQPRYLVCLSPFLFLLVARGLRALPGPGRAALGSLTAGVLLCGTAGYYYSNAVIDPRFAVAADLVRASSGPREPIVHVSLKDFAPLRYYYLPERAHLAAKPEPAVMPWLAALPGGAPVLSPEQLSRFPRCVVVDPRREVIPRRIGLLSGRELASRLERR